MFQNLIRQTFTPAVVEKSRRKRDSHKHSSGEAQEKKKKKKKKPITRRGEAERGEMLRPGRLRRVR